MRSMVEGARDSSNSGRSKAITAAKFIAFRRQRRSESGAPSTTVRSLRELQWSPSPAIAGAEDCYPANVPQFFAKFSAPRSDSAKMV